ncbi:MAG: rRNA pseudouridine synthase [Clostridia bacterium]|nr:rRNA pseudouridine synthase [Clostridia bacterium]
MEKIRLDRFLSNQLQMSRSEAHNAIRGGHVTVNGQTVRTVGQAVVPTSDAVLFCGKSVDYKKHIYLLMHKPAGVLSASNDKKRETVVDLVEPSLRRSGMFPVGRLDKDTTGLLILTDDGEFGHRIISPKSGIPKRYLATLDGKVTEEMVLRFKAGVTLADGTVCRPAILEKAGENKAYLTLTEGKYHEVKRMFGTVGLGVNALHRESIGGLVLPDDLPAGKYTEMTLESLEKAIYDESYTF